MNEVLGIITSILALVYLFQLATGRRKRMP